MKTQIDRQKIVSGIIKAAKSYKQNLVGKTFLYVFDNKYIEVMFKTKDFRHLTGVDTALSAQEFYKKSYQGKLQASQIFFSARHPYSLAQKKLKHLQDISSLAMGESFMLKDVNTQTESYKYGTTDLEFSLCFNKECDINGIEQGDCFIAKSLRDEDCFSKSNDVFTITHIFSKSNDKKNYDTLLYMDKNSSIQSIGDDIKELLSDTLFTPIETDKSLLESSPKEQDKQCKKETDYTTQISNTTVEDKPQQNTIPRTADSENIAQQLEHCKQVIHRTNRILNENPDLKRQFIAAKKAYEQKLAADKSRQPCPSSKPNTQQNKKKPKH